MKLKLEEYMNEWGSDSIIDTSNISMESLKVPRLHSKYMNFLSSERIRYKKLIEAKNKLEVDLEDYYLGKLDGRDIGRDPYQMTETRTSASKKVSTDKDMVKVNLALLTQEEIVLFLKDVIQSINNRNFTIKNYVDIQKFLNGGN